MGSGASTEKEPPKPLAQPVQAPPASFQFGQQQSVIPPNPNAPPVKVQVSEDNSEIGATTTTSDKHTCVFYYTADVALKRTRKPNPHTIFYPSSSKLISLSSLPSSGCRPRWFPSRFHLPRPIRRYNVQCHCPT